MRSDPCDKGGFYSDIGYNTDQSQEYWRVFQFDLPSMTSDKIVNSTKLIMYLEAFTYPNPAKTRTNIEIDNYTEANIRIEIVNIHGMTIKLLCDEMMTEGKFNIDYETSGLPAGIYNIKLIHKSRDSILQTNNKLVVTK